jgi:hypothetical protein
MSTYTEQSPGLTDVNKVRLLIGDNESKEELLSDGEIKYFLDDLGSVKRAAVAAARSIAASFARKADEAVGKVSENNSGRAKQYLAIADKLETDFTSVAGAFWGGSTLTDDKAIFKKGMFENVGAEPYD